MSDEPRGSPSRRQFLRGGLALAGLGLLAACGNGLPAVQPRAQRPARVPRIGILSAGNSSLPRTPQWQGFFEGLRDLGYVDGQNVALEWRYAEGREERLPELAAELVRLPADVIVTVSTPPAQAARAATDTVPIVILQVGDPVALRLVASLARPGGNVTGVANIHPELGGKRLALLQEAFPSLSRVAVIWNPANPTLALVFRETRIAADALRVEVQSLHARSADDVELAFAAASRDHAEALLPLEDTVTVTHRQRIVDLANQSRMPAMYPRREYVDIGGLMGYGANAQDMFRRGAAYVDKILRGAKPADLPVEQPTTFDLVINLKTARALGLTIPQSVLEQVTEVIQ